MDRRGFLKLGALLPFYKTVIKKLIEKCKDGWFEPFVAQLDLEQIDENVWRLQA